MKKILVAYFSASGVTRRVAEKIANTAVADIFEIEPLVAYSKADLNWRDQHSRSSIEMKDLSFRPAIKGNVEDMSQYDTIIIGFPIWWYVAPTIMNTFLESNDFSRKRIALFATSGGSDFGKTVEMLRPSVDVSVEFISKKLLNPVSENEIYEWVKNIM